MGFIKEFKEFAVKGNMVDMAVGIIIGGAFGKIVSSLVNDVVMPPVGLLLGGTDFSNLTLTLKSATKTDPAVTLNWGTFVQNGLDFLILAFAIFWMVKAINTLKKSPAEEATPPAAPPQQEVLLSEIRDLLKNR